MSDNNIARWNVSTWTPLGSGLDEYVFALAVNASGHVYISSRYIWNVGNDIISDIAQWNLNEWLPLASEGAIGESFDWKILKVH